MSLFRPFQDDDVSVIILAAEGPHFSSGHDLREQGGRDAMADQRTVGTWCGFSCAGAEAQMAREKEIYIGLSERWRREGNRTATIERTQTQAQMNGGSLPADIKRTSALRRVPPLEVLQFRSECGREGDVCAFELARDAFPITVESPTGRMMAIAPGETFLATPGYRAKTPG